MSTTPQGAQQAKQELAAIYDVKDLGAPSFILGMAIEQDEVTGTISLLQKAYLNRVIERFGMDGCNPHSTLLPSGLQLTEAMSPQSEADYRYMADKPYCKVLGSLMWAQVATRPNLFFVVGLLARFQANPGPAHWRALIHVLGYVKGTLGY